jgi:DNA gyrase/topoisomerase IV subunit A
MTENKNTYIWILIAVLLAAIGGLVAWNLTQRHELNEMVEQMTIEKEELQEEYEDLAIQFDGYQQMDIRNDSLQDLLSREQQRVQDLLEELRHTKASNARKIAELKKELATVRMVMKDYVRQIDSLNATNARLTAENQQFKAENQQVKEQNTQLSTLNEQLTETVTRASMMEVTTCTVTMLNKNDRKTRMVSHLSKLQFDYTIAKNITCPPGLKDLYVRVMDPNGNLIGEDETHLFAFESDEIPYSLTQQIEYTGEAYEGTCYLALEKAVEGFYTMDFFCDGNLIGSFPFQLKK